MQEITLDIIPGLDAPAVCYASQKDNNRRVKINLTENRKRYALTGQELLTLQMRTQSGERLTAAMDNPGGSQIIAEFTEAMTQAAGANVCSIHIKVNEHKEITSAKFALQIEGKPNRR